MGYLLSMRLRLSRRVMVLAALLAAASLPAAVGDRPWYPDGYRAWTMTRFRLQGPEHPNYEKQGGFRHYYANGAALASWGKFRDGAVVVDERVHARLNDQKAWEEAGLAHVAVMRKDREHYPDTGGWYFNIFSAHDTAIGITPAQAKARCFDACHKAQEARGYVFSDTRR